MDTKRTLAKSASVPAKSYDAPRNGSQRDEGDERPASKCATLQSSKSISAMKDTSSRQFGTMSSLLPNQTGRRNFSHVQGGQRGIMEKFLLSRGRLSQPATFNSPSPVGPAPLIPAQSSAITPGSSAGDPVGVMHPTGKASLASVRHAPTVVRPIEIQAFKHDEVL